MWRCQECGRRFRTTKSAERAALEGCPGCGGTDIDLDTGEGKAPTDYEVARNETGDDTMPAA